jgi:hypothetical protein
MEDGRWQISFERQRGDAEHNLHVGKFYRDINVQFFSVVDIPLSPEF